MTEEQERTHEYRRLLIDTDNLEMIFENIPSWFSIDTLECMLDDFLDMFEKVHNVPLPMEQYDLYLYNIRKEREKRYGLR